MVGESSPALGVRSPWLARRIEILHGGRRVYAPRPQTAGEDRFQGYPGVALRGAVCEPSGRQRPRALSATWGLAETEPRGRQETAMATMQGTRAVAGPVTDVRTGRRRLRS